MLPAARRPAAALVACLEGHAVNKRQRGAAQEAGHEGAMTVGGRMRGTAPLRRSNSPYETILKVV
jgi:hypothetical protein